MRYLLAFLLLASPAFAAGTIQPVGVDTAPNHARACVKVSGCGGVVVSSGPKWSRIITARHCYGGAKIGQKFPVQFIDGSKSEATLLTTDHRADLAMLAIPTKDVLATCKLAVGRPDRARYEAVGWPARQICTGGVCRQEQVLTYFSLHPDKQQPFVKIHGEGQQFDGKEVTLWQFHVDRGGNTPGASGMPIFANGQFVAVNTNNNGHDQGTISYAAYTELIDTFIRESDGKASGSTRSWNLGEWKEPARNFADAPPPLMYGSNTPLKVNAPGLPATIVAEAPQIADAPPAPDATTEPPLAPIPPNVYKGIGKIPADLKTIKKRTAEIDRLRHELAELESKSHEQHEIPPPPTEHESEIVPEMKPEPKKPELTHAVIAAICGSLLMFAACVTHTMRT